MVTTCRPYRLPARLLVDDLQWTAVDRSVDGPPTHAVVEPPPRVPDPGPSPTPTPMPDPTEPLPEPFPHPAPPEPPDPAPRPSPPVLTTQTEGRASFVSPSALIAGR
jgi:hypothetical protein